MSWGVNIGVTKQLREFFERNPLEELTKEDMAAKFGVSHGTIENALWYLKREGLIERAIVYRRASNA